MDEQSIRNELVKTLADEPKNYSRILELSNILANYDETNIRFSVDAGVIDRLGNELVARQETAVSELVKNAYDADTVELNLTFINSNDIGGRLIIADDGEGMNRDQLINGFMRISSTDKIHNPYSEIYNRKRAGQKGIGRFAVQRLGDKLTIITQTTIGEEALKLTIEWDKYTVNNELHNITNVLETFPKKRQKGTTLIIDGLRDKWTEAAIKRIYRYVSDILQPFPLCKNEEGNKDLLPNDTINDPGFKPVFYILLDGKPRKRVGDERLMIYNHATAVIDGSIDIEGNGKFSIESSKLDFSFEDIIGSNPDNNLAKFDKLKSVNFRAYYYIYQSNLIPKTQESAIRKLANIAGGIRLYRNGFRVLPYGEPGDDWLSLDLSTRRRSLLPVHANLNFFGFVEINDSSTIASICNRFSN